MKGLYIPILAILVYADDTFVMTPSKKTGIIGCCILFYGLVISLLGYLSIKSCFPVELAIICMPILHEIMREINENIENQRDRENFKRKL
ncbi:hypothetical protein [Cellulosilyticum sp. I15G10I2]|uniref:hypothetical protein n=1 Tax=Cellulosilyticum sp. I15G10I2 TaxID=1892843 RepID=UPI001A9A6A8D|nr:hypothetical protein [Cellulosilyticum sp. I15G10I2]